MAAATASATALTGVQKAAILMVTLGSGVSGPVLKRMTEQEVDAITGAIAKLDAVTSQQVEAVLEEANRSSKAPFTRGGLDYVRKMLAEAFGPETAMRVLDRLVKSMDQESVDFGSLRKVDPLQLAKFIQDEHPQTIALVLSHLDPSQAAALLNSLPLEVRADVSIRMADLDRISPESVRVIASVIGQKLKNLGDLSREARGGVRAVADMFNRLEPNSCAQLMDAIERNEPALFEKIRRYMFVFEDLLAVDAAGMREILSKTDRKLLVTALKGTSEELRQHFFASLSQRGAEMLDEDLASLGPVKLKEVDAAQQAVITVARELEKDGVISLKNSGADQYVV
ncbi:MAG TPA: flagellar motor switch protein FliG [Bryobacteraceae bacterium]|nr:flagellar motor switch protein FliG [Bryobacteraceae bacterium]